MRDTLARPPRPLTHSLPPVPPRLLLQAVKAWRGPFARAATAVSSAGPSSSAASPLVYVDCTAGGAGHSSHLLSVEPRARLLALDRDQEAVSAARLRLPQDGRAHVTMAAFGKLAHQLAKKHNPFRGLPVRGILADIGVSSHQIDTPERGFSYATDGPLDMRMHGPVPVPIVLPPTASGDDGARPPAGAGPSPSSSSSSSSSSSTRHVYLDEDPTKAPNVTAADLVNLLPEAELRRLLADYGEEPDAAAIARALVVRRTTRPFTRTHDLARVVVEAIRGASIARSRNGGGGGGSDGAAFSPAAAARTFQALRIAVNGELRQLSRLLAVAPRVLATGGTLAIITFHSLEDRMVKNAFLELEREGLRGSAGARVTAAEKVSLKALAEAAAALPQGQERGDVLLDPSPQAAAARYRTLEAVRAGEEEVARNPRSRSATLRVLQRVA
jgi:16S rRNA (cytosine1402-N4)-methyltransferase